LTDHFFLKHTKSTIYYPQRNGQVEFTNKVFGSLLMKLVNDNHNDWDEHMSTFLFSYRYAFKVGIGHIPFQLAYGLYPLLPTKYLLPSKLGHIYDPTLVIVIISHLLELEKL
jgi:hypothetical protein